LALGSVELLVRQFGVGEPIVGYPVGWFFVSWTIFTAILWLGSWGVHAALGVTFTLLLATFILLAAAVLISSPPNPAILHIAGYVGIATAIAAWYIVAADVLNWTYGRTILPLGPAAGTAS
jgi:succinate-acetate transporter protein